jgi:hypothetical protein
VAGFAVAITGQTLRAAVIGLAYIKRGGRGKKIYAGKLVQEGLFAHSRNPLYLGNMMIHAGLFLILDSRWGYLLGVPFFLFAYLTIVMAEEEFLALRFGASYDEYCRRVNRFIPSLAGLGRTLAGAEFDWRRLVRKEYGATFAWLSAALAALVWGDWLRRGWPAAQMILGGALAAWIPIVAAYALARSLKKSGKLGSD